MGSSDPTSHVMDGGIEAPEAAFLAACQSGAPGLTLGLPVLGIPPWQMLTEASHAPSCVPGVQK